MHFKNRDAHVLALVRLRGLAALCVVFGHAFNVRSLVEAKEALNPLFLAVSSATVVFVLLAGILFQMRAIPRLYRKETSTLDILRRRWGELSGTYLSVGLFLAVIFTFKIAFKPDIDSNVNPALFLVTMMLNGSMAYTYWYVPFFLLLMALTPLHVWFSQRKPIFQIILIGIGLTLSALIHRPDGQTAYDTLHSLAYYLPVFWLGMLLGSRWQQLCKWMNGNEMVLFASFIAVGGIQILIGQKSAYLHPFGEVWGPVDLFVIQKVLFDLLFVSVFNRRQSLSMPALDWIADRSLKIFFMHPIILFFLLDTAPHLSGFFVPELVAHTGLMIVAGVRLQRTLANLYLRLPTRWQRIGLRVQAVKTPE